MDWTLLGWVAAIGGVVVAVAMLADLAVAVLLWRALKRGQR